MFNLYSKPDFALSAKQLKFCHHCKFGRQLLGKRQFIGGVASLFLPPFAVKVRAVRPALARALKAKLR
jgi:hypothetical protein